MDSFTGLGDNRKSRYIVVFALLFAGVLLMLIANICIGTVSIPVQDLVDIIFKRDFSTYSEIVWQIRIPRAAAALVLGGGLALSGYLMQSFFRNPIAGPFVLGISSGAKMIVAIVMVLALQYGIRLNSVSMILAAFAGAMLSMCFVLIISRAVDRMGLLIVAGVMIGYICSAVTDFIVTFADDSNIVNLHHWSLGSFSGISGEDVIVMTAVTVICFLSAFFLSKSIYAYSLGEAYAANLGVNIRMLRIMLVIISGVLSACVTAFAGPVSFVGIAVPHILRQMFKTTKAVILIPACFLGGAIFCLASDLLSRMLFAPTELSVSTVTAFFGAPIVIVMMLKNKKDDY